MPLKVSSVCRNITPSTTLRLNAMVAEKRKQGLDIISLAAGEPDFATPAHICQAADEAIRLGRTKYTASSGIPELRQAIARHIKANKALDYQPGEVIVCTGAKQAVIGALYALLEPGDEVLLPAPCWLSYPEMVRMAGGVPVVVNTSIAQGFLPDFEQMAAAVTPRTRAIILNTPNNPTGVVWPRQALEMVAELARKHDLAILSDEIYEALVYTGAEHIAVAGLSADTFGRTITISGFSKSYAMTGWRLGYASGPKAIVQAMDAYQSHATGNPNSIAQYAGLAALTGDQGCVEAMCEAFQRRCGLMLQCLSWIPGISFPTPRGAFYVLVDISPLLGRQYQGRLIRDDADFAELLLEHALVSAVPGEPFYAPGCLRLSYAIDEKLIQEAADRLRHFVDSLV
ncbi:MAG: pyridoxal phosphate-dependent aminotransferase [Christensenellales bacterium]